MTVCETESWEAYLDENFPGYLLPASARQQVSEASAKAFLDALGVRPADLDLLKLMSLLAARSDALEAFASYWLPELARVLPSRSTILRKEWRGGYQGRLDVAATLAYRIGGEPDRYVTRARKRDFDLPENVLVRVVANRTKTLLERLHGAKLIREEGWSQQAVLALSNLQKALQTSALREVSIEPISSVHILAARNAQHPGYDAALRWYQAMSDALDSTGSEKLARILAEGALRPMDEPKKFEVAVLLALLDGLRRRLTPEMGWNLEARVIATGRDEVATFRCGRAEVGVYYDRSLLPLNSSLGARDAGVAHYLSSGGRLRPDITVRTRSESGLENHVVFEIKLTQDLGYASQGFGEAILYRHEYSDYLRGWPKAVLVTSRNVTGEERLTDDVIALNWANLSTSKALDSLVANLTAR